MRTLAYSGAALAALAAIGYGWMTLTANPSVTTATAGNPPPLAWPKAPDPEDAPGELTFRQDTADRGPFQEAFTHRIAIKNISEKAVAISDISTSCSCSKWDIDRRELPAGGEAILTVAVTPRIENLGRHPYVVNILYKGAEVRARRLAFLATYQPEVLAPASVPLHSITGTVSKCKVVIADYRTTTFAVSELKLGSNHLKARAVGEPKRINSIWQHEIEIESPGTAPLGDQTVPLIVTTTDPAHARLEVRIDLARVPRLRVTPPSIQLPGNDASIVYIDDRLGGPVGPIAATGSDGTSPAKCSRATPRTARSCAFPARRTPSLRPTRSHRRSKSPRGTSPARPFA